MPYVVRVIQDHFCIGSTHHPKGSELTVSAPIFDYMIRTKSGECVEDPREPKAVAGYNRRDMQAEDNPAVVPPPEKKTSSRKRYVRKKVAA